MNSEGSEVRFIRERNFEGRGSLCKIAYRGLQRNRFSSVLAVNYVRTLFAPRNLEIKYFLEQRLNSFS